MRAGGPGPGRRSRRGQERTAGVAPANAVLGDPRARIWHLAPGSASRAPAARADHPVSPASYTRPVEADPFAVLGLPARPEVTDDEVRAAWRRIAATTHPDRADGGDPARFAAAAAAYTALRTRSGRGEALADLAAPRPRAGVPRPGVPGWRRPHLGLARLVARVRRGRPARLALRLAVVAGVSAAAVAVAGWAPATPALITGALTWLLLTARHDLAPPP